MNITKEKNEEKKNNNKIINKNKSISNSKMNNNNLIPFQILLLGILNLLYRNIETIVKKIYSFRIK